MIFTNFTDAKALAALLKGVEFSEQGVQQEQLIRSSSVPAGFHCFSDTGILEQEQLIRSSSVPAGFHCFSDTGTLEQEQLIRSSSVPAGFHCFSDTGTAPTFTMSE